MKKTIMILAILSTSWAWAQDSLVEYSQINGTSPDNSFSAGQFRGQIGPSNLELFPDRALFDQLVPVATQSCEDFEEGIIGGIIGFPAPLDETTNNGVFAPGDIVPGLSISDDPINDSDGMGGSASGLVGIPAAAFGNATQVVVSNTFVDSTNLNFTTPQIFVAMDVVSFTAESEVEVTFFDEMDNVIDILSGTVNPAGAFLGVQSDIPISRINVFSLGNGAEGADNICFSNNGLTNSQPVPALGTWSLLILTLIMVLVAGMSLHKRFSA